MSILFMTKVLLERRLGIDALLNQCPDHTTTWFVSSAGGELLDCRVAGWKIVASNGSRNAKQGLQRTRKMILDHIFRAKDTFVL